MTKTIIMGAVASIALLTATGAHAQMDPATQGHPQTATADDPVARNRAVADQYGLPPNILTHREDEYGRPIPRRIEDAIAELGPEGARLAAIDDSNFCAGLAELRELEQRLEIVENEVVAAGQAVVAATTEAERRVAIARQERARNNLWQLLLAGLRLGLVTQIPGVGWAYGGIMLGNEASNWLNRRQHDLEMQAHDAMVDMTFAMVSENTLRLRALDLRNDLYDRRGALFDAAMGRYCEAHQPFYDRLDHDG